MQNEMLKTNIMRRVYTIYIIKNVARPLALEFAIVAALIGSTAFFVSLQDILANVSALPSIQTLGTYLMSAFMHAQVIVKTISIGVILAAGFFAYDAMRRLVHMRSLSSY
jgi:hypothetical protein